MKRKKIMAMIMATLISSSLILGNATNTYAADSTIQAKATKNWTNVNA